MKENAIQLLEAAVNRMNRLEVHKLRQVLDRELPKVINKAIKEAENKDERTKEVRQ